MTVGEAIRQADSLLPGTAARDGERDERREAILAVGAFVETDPDAVWAFVRLWGSHDDEDLRRAIATCLLEPLLEKHFDAIFPLAEAEVHASPRFAETYRRCGALGQSADPDRRERFERPLRLAGPARVAFVIADALPADAEAILALQQLAYQSEARRYNDWSIPPLVETLESVREQIAARVVLKATLSDRLVGSVRGVVEGDVCEVGRLIVHPDTQRRGIGAALLAAIEARCPAVSCFELFTGDRSVSNLRLYRRHGYVETRRLAVSPEVSLVYLRKPAGGRTST